MKTTSSPPSQSDFRYRTDYYNALARWRYHNDCGYAGKTYLNARARARRKAYALIDQIRHA